MRTVGLLLLIILLPIYAHAAILITEVMYDYPGSEGSGDHDWVEIYNNGQSTVDLGGSTVRFMERGNNHLITSFEGGGTILAPGAAAIIANNPSQVKNDFSTIGLLLDSSFSLTGTTTALGIIIDGVNVSSSSYAPVASASNLGDSLHFVNGNWIASTPTPGIYTDSAVPSESPFATTATASVATVSASTAPPEYIPIPKLRILTSGDRIVSSGADTSFTAVVYDSKGNKRDEALVRWSFGDGMQRTGANVLHAYYDPGEYIVVVHATTSDGGDARSEVVVTVKNAGIRIASVSSRGITLANDDSRTLDLSLWRLGAGGKEFKIPADTQILAGRTILFPSQVIDLPSTDSASLLYPSGEVADTYPKALSVSHTPIPSEDRQPSVSVMSYKKVQTVEQRTSPITSTSVIIKKNEEAVLAPAVVVKPTTAGASVITALAETVPATDARSPGLFRSPWTFGFLGVMALAGGAFIFL